MISLRLSTRSHNPPLQKNRNLFYDNKTYLNEQHLHISFFRFYFFRITSAIFPICVRKNVHDGFPSQHMMVYLQFFIFRLLSFRITVAVLFWSERPFDRISALSEPVDCKFSSVLSCHTECWVCEYVFRIVNWHQK